jgi:hypothetical protein
MTPSLVDQLSMGTDVIRTAANATLSRADASSVAGILSRDLSTAQVGLLGAQLRTRRFRYISADAATPFAVNERITLDDGSAWVIGGVEADLNVGQTVLELDIAP